MVTRKTRLMSGFAALLMIVSMFACFILPASAADAVPSKGLYDATALPDIADGYTGAKAYQVKDAAGMYALADWVNEEGFSFSGITIYQTADIDLGWEFFPGIGYTHGSTSKRSFNGTFDGNGFVIKGLYVARTGDSVGTAGLFATVSSGAVIKNVGVASGFVFGRNWVGGVVGRTNGNNCQVLNCWNAATVYATDAMSAGGVVGSLAGSGVKALNCYNVGLLICPSGKVAGISGWTNNANAEISNCYNAGQIVSYFDGTASTEPQCLYEYSPIVIHDYSAARATASANNYYVKGRGKLSSVKESGLTVIPGTEKAIVATDAATGVEASALTDGSLATAMNGAGLPAAPDGYTVAFENVEGVGYPVLTYRKDGAIVAQRAAATTQLVNGDETPLKDSALWALLKQGSDFANKTDMNTLEVTIADATELWLAALITGTQSFTGTIKLAADIDMADLKIEGLKYHVPFVSAGGNFKGTFDGQNHTIKGWTVYASLFDDTPRAGLIPYTGGATVKNLGMVDSYSVYERITGTGGYLYPALIVGREYGPLVMDNCFAEGTVYCKNVTNTNNFGGVFGTAWGDDVVISNCWSDVTYIDGLNVNRRPGHAMGKLNTAPANVSNVYQVFEGDNYKGNDNYTDEGSTNLTGVSCKDASLAAALNEKMGDKWIFNGEYTTFKGNTAVGNVMNNVEAAIDVLDGIDAALFVEKDAIEAAAAKLAAATVDTAAAALADYNALTFTLKEGAYPAFSQREAYLKVLSAPKEWALSSYEDIAALAKTSLYNNYTGYSFHLTNDIDMKNRHVDSIVAVRWYLNSESAVKTYGGDFKATLDGHNYVIKNYANYVNTSVQRYGGFIGRANGGTVKNLGIANGLIKTHNTNDNVEPLIGGIVGECTGNTKISYCYSNVDIDCSSFSGTKGVTISGIARTTNAGNVVDNCYFTGNIKGNTGHNSYAGGLSGYSQASGEFYNCFYGGGTLTGKYPGLLRYNANNKEAYYANTYIAGNYAFDPQRTHNNEADFELKPEAYTNGELAYKLNTGYVEGKGTKGYYTLVDNKTVFGTEANQTRLLTIEKKLEDGTLVETVSKYVNAGTVYAIEAPAGYAVVDTDLNGYDAEAGTFVMPTTDEVLTLEFSGEADALMQNIVDSYAPYIEGHEKNFDLFTQEEQMRAAYDAALSVLEGTATDVPAAVAAATENFVAVANLTLKKTFPYYPSLRNIATYKELNTAGADGRIHWGIHTPEDWYYLIEDNFNPVNAKYLASDPATKIGGADGNYTYIVNVTRDIDFKNEKMEPLYCAGNWTLDGRGYTFKNVNIDVEIADPTTATYIGLLGGQPWNVIIQNLGMTGSVKVSGTNANNKDVFISSFYGYNGGYSARLFNSWSTADVVLDVSGGGNKIASGLINYRRAVAATNCWFGGTVTSTGSSAVIWCTDGSSDEIYKNVWSTAQGVQLSNIANGASSTAGILSADAAATGELAYLMNNNYVACDFDKYYPAGRAYFDVAEGETVRVDADPELRKINMKLSGQADKALYAKDGEVVTLNYVAGATYTIASGKGTLAGDQLTVDGDAEITVDASGILILDALQVAVNYYDDKDITLYKDNGGETLADVLAVAQGIIDGTVPAVQPQVDAYVDLLKGFELANEYPKLPKASEMAKNPGMAGYLVYDLADLETVANKVGEFTADQTIYLMADITVTEGSSANNMAGLKASIDGNGFAIKNVHVIGTEDDWGGSAWLGNYAGNSIKNLVIDGWTTEKMGWQGALLVSTAAANTTFENITIKDSVVTGGTVRNGLSALVGIVRTTTVTIKNIRVENTKLLRNSGNFGFIVGRNENGTVNIDGIYLIDNTIGAVNESANKEASGRGVVVGESTGATTIKNAAIFNTSFTDEVTVNGILAGTLKVGDDGASAGATAAALTLNNIMAEDNGEAPLVYRAAANGTCTYTNVYTDAAEIIGKNDVVANTNPVTPDQYAAAAFAMNLTSEIVKWEVPAEGYPEFDTDGKGLPLIIYFKATDNDATTNDYNGSLFTNAEGKLVGITNELLEAAYWENSDEWADMVFTESTTITGTPIPVHTCVWGNHSHIDGTNTHYAECTWTNGTVECPKTAIQDCDFTFDVEPKDPNAAPEEASHVATCACGNGTGEVLCSADEKNWSVETVPGDCETGDMVIYACDVCGYHHVEEEEPMGHDFPETWTKDEVAEGETQTHSHVCANGCGESETENCTFSGEWEVTKDPTGSEPGLQVKYCDKNCGAVIEEEIPALPSITIDYKNGVPGQTMDVAIVLNNNTGLSGADFYVTYDSDVLTLESVQSGDWNLELLGFGPASQPDENGMVTSIVNFAIFADLNTDGEIAILTFRVAEDAEAGDYDFAVEALASTFEGVEYYFEGYDGFVTVADSMRGDINRDNVVTIADAVLMLRVANGDTNIPVELDLEAADVITETNTPEMTINTDDVVRVLQYLNGTIAEV